MGISKTEFYSSEQNKIAILIKSLAHPARIAIIEYLLKVDKCICGDIVNEIKLSQSTISQHLKELKNSGIIKGTIEGNSICYCIDQDVFTEISNYFTNINQELKTKKLNCC